jgi:chromosome segregation ATPase
MNWEHEYKRLHRRYEKQKRKNAALEKRVRQLESKVADTTINLTRSIEKSFERVLCNVRMVPVLGISGGSKIVEFNVTDAPKK